VIHLLRPKTNQLDSRVGVDKLASGLATQLDLMQCSQVSRVIVWLFQLDQMKRQSIEICRKSWRNSKDKRPN
jgi:hypothetical protein